MPELPEVETMVVGLRGHLLGRSLKHIKIIDKKVLCATGQAALRGLRGSRIVGLSRVGKFLLFHLSYGSTLVFHLRMTGRLQVEENGTGKTPPRRLQMEFEDWDGRLSFIDQRRFGYVALIREGEVCPIDLLLELGPDALRVSRKELREIVGDSNRPVKSLLLDQRVIAGLGNIYVDESLFRAGIHPAERASDIDEKRVGQLHRVLKAVLAKAIACGGSSVRNYRTSSGASGTYQDHHRVYGRKGETCHRCGGTIAYGKVASRGTHFCPVCQPPPRKKRKKAGKKRPRRQAV